MRFVLASIVATIVVADESCDQKEHVSMLQTKDRVGLSSKDTDLIRAVNDASPMFEEDVQVAQFLDEVKNAIEHMKDADNKEALLQRASQGKQMEDLIGRFQALPAQNQQKLEDVGGQIFEKLPVSQRAALIQQVSQALDSSTEGKTQTRTEKTAEGKTTITENRDTGYLHRHYHGRRGTESTSRGKYGGHEHYHSYAHDGQGGQATTVTRSRGLTGHEHDHTHQHRLNNGVTSTVTGTRTRDANGNVHEHSHDHEHRPDQATVTNTRSRTNDEVHTHSHVHNERNGNSVTNSGSWSNGRKTWGHHHHHDAASGRHWSSDDHDDHDDFDKR